VQESSFYEGGMYISDSSRYVPENMWFYIVPLKRYGYSDELTCVSQTVLLTCKNI